MFAELYRRHHRAVRDFCRRRVAGDGVDDAVAEGFLMAWRRFHDVPARDEAALVWLYGVAYRVIGHQWRSTARRRRLDGRLRSVVHRPASGADEAVIYASSTAWSSTRRPASPPPTPKCCAWWPGSSCASPMSPPCWASLQTPSPNACTGPGATWPASTAASKPDSRPPLLRKEVPGDHRRRGAAPVRTSRPGSGRRRRPVVDAADYLDALRTRSSNVTIIEATPTPTEPTSGRRRAIILAAAAAVVIVVGAVVLATRDDDSTAQSSTSHRPPPKLRTTGRRRTRSTACGPRGRRRGVP